MGNVASPVVACGHSHVPRSVRLPSGQLCVNPGRVGVQAYTDDHPEHCIMELGTPDAHCAAMAKTTNGWACESYAVPYDHGSMAKLARARGRHDWERRCTLATPGDVVASSLVDSVWRFAALRQTCCTLTPRPLPTRTAAAGYPVLP